MWIQLLLHSAPWGLPFGGCSPLTTACLWIKQQVLNCRVIFLHSSMQLEQFLLFQVWGRVLWSNTSHTPVVGSPCIKNS